MVTPTPLTGEPLALDLVNTRAETPRGPLDLVATTEGLRSWLELQEERIPEALATPQGLTEGHVAAVHAVRDHITTAIGYARHGQAPPAGVLHGINRAQRAAPATQVLSWNGATVVASTHRSGELGTRLAAHLAAAAADLLTSPEVTHIRACQARDCIMLFLPAHPRRRWCSPTRCGNRIRVARHQQRHQ